MISKPTLLWPTDPVDRYTVLMVNADIDESLKVHKSNFLLFRMEIWRAIYMYTMNIKTSKFSFAQSNFIRYSTYLIDLPFLWARFSYKMQSRFLTLTFKVHSKYIEYIVLLHMINILSAVTLHFWSSAFLNQDIRCNKIQN